jgi:ferredoxin
VAVTIDRDFEGELTMRVHIDLEACTGHGRCYALASDIFDSDDMGHSVARFDEVPTELEDQARIAVMNCPEQAISVTDD